MSLQIVPSWWNEVPKDRKRVRGREFSLGQYVLLGGVLISVARRKPGELIDG